MSYHFSNKKVLVVVAHPDDEILGAGGTLHRIISRQACEVKAVIMGEGITSRSNSRNKLQCNEELIELHKNIENATERIGISSTSLYELPDNRFDSINLLDIIKHIEREISEFQPQIIFTHHAGDLNIDHQRTSQAVITATRPVPGEPPRMILAFETPSSTEWQVFNSQNVFLPNIFIPLSREDLTAKQNALKAYTTECQKYPHPRSCRALEVIARRWGTVIGVEFAEAFNIMRWVLSEEDH
jgi:LmbE family N-acetylglucosaminyl deacetylase